MHKQSTAIQFTPRGDAIGKESFRGFMLDLARCQENRGYYRTFIDFAAQRGLNLLLWHFTDDQGCALQFDAAPGLASPNAYSKAEMRELVRYAADRGIQIVPELASLGHCRYITRLAAYRHLQEGDSHFSGMCPVSPETRTLIRTLIEETAETFASPDFHVGLDEVNIGEHPLTRASLKTQSQVDLLADYIEFVHGVVRAAGRRMWMWGDGLLKHATLLDRVSRDIVICNWQYAPDASPATTQTLLNAGFNVLPCSALISHDQPLFPGEQFAIPNVRSMEAQQLLLPSAPSDRRSVLGHVNTIWTPVRFIADSLWLGIDLAATIVTEGPDTDVGAQAQKFGKQFYGLAGENAFRFGEAGRILYKESPLRDEWLAVVKLEPLPANTRERVTKLAEVWMRTQAVLRKLSPSVRHHQVEFRSFLLLIELLAHCYDAAARLYEDSATDLASVPDLLRRGQAILDRVESTWDKERFADDSRKYKAPIPSYQNDHLIPLIRTGLAALQSHYEARSRRAEMRGALKPVATVASRL